MIDTEPARRRIDAVSKRVREVFTITDARHIRAAMAAPEPIGPSDTLEKALNAAVARQAFNPSAIRAKHAADARDALAAAHAPLIQLEREMVAWRSLVEYLRSGTGLPALDPALAAAAVTLRSHHGQPGIDAISFATEIEESLQPVFGRVKGAIADKARQESAMTVALAKHDADIYRRAYGDDDKRTVVAAGIHKKAIARHRQEFPPTRGRAGEGSENEQ